MERFDPLDNKWEVVGDMIVPRYFFGCCEMQGRDCQPEYSSLLKISKRVLMALSAFVSFLVPTQFYRALWLLWLSKFHYCRWTCKYAYLDIDFIILFTKCCIEQ